MHHDLLQKLLAVFKLEPRPVERLVIKLGVIEQISELAQEVYPKEFVALLEGELKGTALEITSLLFQPFKSSTNTSVFSLNYPILSRVIGTVHSHPGSSNRPSSQDLTLFRRTGCIHLIISNPFNSGSIAAYTSEGCEIKFEMSEIALRKKAISEHAQEPEGS